MSEHAKYDPAKIDYDAVYFQVQADRAVLPAFDTKTGKVKRDPKGTPVIADSLVLVKIGQFRKPSGKVDRPVYQCTQLHAYREGDIDKFRGETLAVDVREVENGSKPAPVTNALAGF